MAYPTILTNGVPMHVTHVFNADRQGWSENYYLWVTGSPTNPYPVCEQWSQAMNELRLSVMPNDYQVEAVRVANADTVRDASLIKAPKLEMGKGALTGAAAAPERGWQVTVNDSTKQVRTTRIYRGWTQRDVPYLVQGGAVVADKPEVVRNWFNALRPLLTTQQTFDGAPGQAVVALRTYDRDPTTNPPVRVIAFGVDQQGRLTAKTDTISPQFNLGDTVFVSHKRRKCVTGISGAVTVVDRATSGSGFLYTLDKQPCCGANVLPLLTGEIQKRVTAYVKIDEANLGFTGKRDVGRAYFITPGRHPGRCC